MDITYLISPTAIKYLTNISDNLSEKYITTAIRETQQVDLCQVLGDNMLVSIENMVIDGSIQDDENRAYKTLLDNYISYFLAYGTVVKLIPIVSVKLDNAGAVQNGDEKVENISLKDMFELSGFYMQKADYYKARLQKYLREHYKDYPQLDCSSEIHSAYSSPFYLGGIRHKRVPRGHSHTSGSSTPLRKYTISYYVDNVLFTTKSYVQGTPIKYVEAPQKEGYNFNVWIYEKNGVWENLPDFMPDYDIVTYAHYLPVEGEQKYYTIRYRVADWREDGEITFDNMAYIPEPFEWLQCVEREYDPNTREGWAKLTHPSLTADSEIRLQKFPGHDALFMLDLSELNNCYMTDRMFAENTTLREFYPPKGLVGAEGYDFYNCQYLSTINFATADGYKEYQPYSYPMTGAFCNCVSLTAILADNQFNMYSDNGNLYNNSDELMASRYGEVTIKEGCTAIKSEALKARGLTALTIPSSVRKIEAYAISENMELSEVYYTGTMNDWARIEKDDVNTIFQDTNVAIIHCSDGDCPIDYSGEEQAEYKVDIYLEWDYYTTQWYKVGDKIELPEPPVREGYVFVNWNWSNGTDWIDEQQYMPNYNLQVHATYAEAKPDYYNVNYYVDGELVDYESYKEGETIEAPTAEKDGHTFLGWDGLPSVMPAHDVDVNASFQVNSYTVTFYVDGEEYHKETVRYWDIIPLPQEPSKEGCTFSHWYGDLHEPTRMPSHDVDTHAIFDINSYKITYVAGDWSEDVTYEYGATVNEKTAPVKEGYSFLYWDELPTTMPAKDITVTAVYERNEYKITYMIDGDTVNEARYYFEDEIQPYVPAVDEGYVFNGWDNEPATMPAHDVVVTGSVSKAEEPEEPSEPEDTTDYSTMYMTLEAIEDSEFTFSGTSYSNFVNYSIDDGVTWNKTKGKDAKTSLIPSGGKVLIKATTDEAAKRVYVLSSGKFKTYGNILSTQHGDDFIGKEAIRSFYVHFYNSTNLVDASNLIFPSSDLTTLSSSNIYASYFQGCTSLVTAPKILPSTSICSFSFQNMFKGCTSLTTPPVIMATSMENSSLYSMFEGCTSLTTAPVINVEHIANYGCYRMFKGCSNLTNVTMLFTSYDTGSTSYALYELLDGVASTGTFYKSPNMPLETIQQHVPSGWTILDYAG